MDDRELLLLAAKAAGITPATFEGKSVGWFVPAMNSVARWNPLDDDGDALRLAVWLKMKIDIGTYDVIAECMANGVLGYQNKRAEGGHEKRTRLAIVCAAAEIGRGIP